MPKKDQASPIKKRRVPANKRDKPVPACDSRLLYLRFPEIAKEWNYDRNVVVDLKTLTYGSDKKFWWKCKINANHEWEASLYCRSSGTGCKWCYGNFAKKSNCLLNLRPDLTKEWHPTRNTLKPDKVSVKSNKDAWWICSEFPSHVWRTAVSSRTDKGTGCPYCSNNLVSDKNRLSIINELVTSEWHPNLNGDLLPSDVAVNSNKNVYWLCKANEKHVWKANIDDRTLKGNGCPHCSIELYGIGTSKTEQNLRAAAEEYFSTRAISDLYYYIEEAIGYKFNRLYGTSFRNTLKPDIWFKINSKNIFIEYDGYYTHNEEYGIKKDKAKSMMLLKNDPNNIVVRIRPPQYEPLMMNEQNYYEFQNDCKSKEKISSLINEIKLTLIRNKHIKMDSKMLCHFLLEE